MIDHATFLDSLFEQIDKAGLDVSDLILDHVAYQTSSSDNYADLKRDFEKLGRVVSEELVGGRRVSVFKLNKPLEYKNHSIQALELVEPKPDQDLPSALQHAEFIYEGAFEKFIEKYPNINWDTSSMNRDEFAHLKLNFDNGQTLKFLHAPILKMFEAKNN